MENNYRRTMAIIMVIILILVVLTGVSYYKEVELAENICLSFLIACTTGVIIEGINGSKQKDYRKNREYIEELEEMRNKIVNFKKGLNNLSRNRKKYNFFNQADRLMEDASILNEQINYLYENTHKKSLIKKFLYNQELNLEHKITSVEEIREDIVNMTDKGSILKKIYRYNHSLDKLLYNVNRELENK